MSPATLLFVQLRLGPGLPKALRTEKIQATLLLDLVGWFCSLHLQGLPVTLCRGHLIQRGSTYMVQKEIISILFFGGKCYYQANSKHMSSEHEFKL